MNCPPFFSGLANRGAPATSQSAPGVLRILCNNAAHASPDKPRRRSGTSSGRTNTAADRADPGDACAYSLILAQLEDRLLVLIKPCWCSEKRWSPRASPLSSGILWDNKHIRAAYLGGRETRKQPITHASPARKTLEPMDSKPEQTRSAVERLSRLDCCAVSDALDKLELSGVVSGLPQLAGSGRIAGRAITMKLGIGTAPPGPTRHLGTTAIEAANPGDVIVVEQKSGVEAGSWGGILALGAKLRGVAGVVADGPVRDIDEAKSFDFPVFARACTAR